MIISFCIGESYGGQYITMLTDRTLERNRQGVRPIINLKVWCLLIVEIDSNIQLLQLESCLAPRN